MPIVEPPSFAAFGLIPFQINAHFMEDDFFEGHMGETRRERLQEFLEENTGPVLAIREGAWLTGSVATGELVLGGENGALLFETVDGTLSESELPTGSDLSKLLIARID